MNKKKQILFGIYMITSFFFGCKSNGQDKEAIIKSKNVCYAATLKSFENDTLYRTVMSAFADTFNVMKNEKQYFGVSTVEKMIDEAIFFNKKKTECLLIVLKKSGNNLVFGNARIVRGEIKQKKWFFKPSKEYTYTDSYFQLYPENSFANLSLLGRYSILTDGAVRRKGCKIDEKFWFVHLKH